MTQKVIIENAISEHRRAVEHFEQHHIGTVEQIAGLITETFNSGHRLFLCGNGGSMADCQHIAGEFVGKFRKVRQPLPAMALSTDVALTTCIANDFSFEELFARQIDALGNAGDLLWAFSTSGTSLNVIAAAKKAAERGMTVISFTGKKESPLEAVSDICLCAAADKTNHAQEVHELAYHIICELIDEDYD